MVQSADVQPGLNRSALMAVIVGRENRNARLLSGVDNPPARKGALRPIGSLEGEPIDRGARLDALREAVRNVSAWRSYRCEHIARIRLSTPKGGA